MNWTFLANRQLTNGTTLAGNAITGADIYFATDRLAAVAPSFTQVRFSGHHARAEGRRR